MTPEPPPEPCPPAPKKSRAWIATAIVFVLAFDLALGWQRAGGAWQSEFGGHPDEAGHYVTGLFVRDAAVMAAHYAADGFHGSPVAVGKEFADDYYAHYPKVGLGVWPPFFYLVQSAWTLPFSPSRGSILLLMCALAATVAVQLFRVLRAEFGFPLAAFGAAAFLSLPLVRNYYGMVMAETLSAALMFGAVLAFGDFLDREKRGDALRFGLLAALAILTKGTGLALALAAPLALLFTRRWHLLKRPALWSAVLIIAVLAGPWTWATRDLGKGGWEEPAMSLHFTAKALPYYATKFGFSLGFLMLLLFGVGAFVKLRTFAGPGRPGSLQGAGASRPEVKTAFGRSSNPGRWAAAGAFILSVLAFQSLAPVGLEARHLIPAVPAVLMFAVAGFTALMDQSQAWKSPGGARIRLFWSVMFGVLVLTTSAWPLSKKGFTGFAPLAEAMRGDATAVDVTLVSSDARGEGMFISEVAMHEHRPGHTILRASKALAKSSWSGSDYAPLFKNDDDLFDYLTNGKIQYLAIDDAVPEDKRRTHQDQLKRVLEQHSDVFALVASAEMFRDGVRQFAPAQLYKIRRKN